MGATRWNLFGIVYAAIVASTLGMLLAAIPFGAYAVFFTQLSSQGYTAQTHIGFLPLYIGLLPVELQVTPTFGALFLVLTGLYVLLIGVAAIQGGGFARALVLSARDGPGALLRNPLSSTIMILGATLLATVILESIQTAVGVQTGGLSQDPFLLFMDFTLSPLIEEVGFRFFLIGVPLAILVLAAHGRPRLLAKALWRPSSAWESEQAKSTDSIPIPTGTLRNFAYFLIALSSLLFGLAHYLSGAGWDIGKVSEAALDGLVLGYLYVRYGLHASIIFHWAVDFASNAFAFYGQGVYGISWTLNSAFSLVPTFDILILVGLPGFLYFANLFLKRVISPHRETSDDDSRRQVYPFGAGGQVQGDLTNLSRRIRRRRVRPDGP